MRFVCMCVCLVWDRERQNLNGAPSRHGKLEWAWAISKCAYDTPGELAHCAHTVCKHSLLLSRFFAL